MARALAGLVVVGVVLLGGDAAPVEPLNALEPQVDRVASEIVMAAIDGKMAAGAGAGADAEADAEAAAQQFTDYPYIDSPNRDVAPPLPNGTKYSSSSGMLKGCKGRPDACGVETECCDLNKCNMYDHVGRDAMTLVVFYADWCPLCRDFEVVYSLLRNKFDPFADVLVARVNGDQNPNLMTDYGITEYPTILLFNRDCYWADEGCNHPAAFVKYSGESNEFDEIVRWVWKSRDDRRLELAVSKNPAQDMGPCGGVAKELTPPGTPCPGMSPPDLDMPPNNDTKLFGPTDPPTLPPTPNLPPPTGGVYPGNAKGWQTKLTKERLEEYHAAGKITDMEYQAKQVELGFAEPPDQPFYIDYPTGDEAASAEKAALELAQSAGAAKVDAALADASTQSRGLAEATIAGEAQKAADLAAADAAVPKTSWMAAPSEAQLAAASAPPPAAEAVDGQVLLQAKGAPRPVCKVADKPVAHHHHHASHAH